MNKFVYLVTDITEYNLRQFTVGIVISSTDEVCTVNFGQTQLTVNKKLIKEFDPLSVGDQFSHKICNICQRYLPVDNFSINQNGKGDRQVRRPSCKECRSEIDGVSISSSEKKKWEECKPHMCYFECPICHKVTIPGLTSKVVLDHDHKTGEIRGWICDSCNTGIGRFKDDPNIIETAKNYLLNSKK